MPTAFLTLPHAATLLDALAAIRAEILAALLAGYAAYFGLSVYAWRKASGRRPLDFVVRPFRWALVWIMAGAALFGLGIVGHWSGIWAWVIIAGTVGIALWPLALLAFSATAWRRAARLAVDERALRRAWGFSALAGLATGGPPILIFLAWAVAQPFAYIVALLASILLAAALLGICIVFAQQTLRRATQYSGEPTIPRSQYPPRPGD